MTAAPQVLVVGDDPEVCRRLVLALVHHALREQQAGRPAPWPVGPEGPQVRPISVLDRQEPLLLDLHGVACALSVSKSTVERMTARGDLPTVRIGGAVRVRRADLEHYVEQLS